MSRLGVSMAFAFLPPEMRLMPVPQSSRRAEAGHGARAGSAAFAAFARVAKSPFPPTMPVTASPRGTAAGMVPPPHSGAGAAAPERRGGTAAMRRWAGALRLGARRGGSS
jgi:hypothetical protein